MRSRSIIMIAAASIAAAAAYFMLGDPKHPIYVAREGTAMDTFISIALHAVNADGDGGELELAADEIFDMLGELDRTMSITSKSSDLSQLGPVPRSVPEDLFRATEAALELSEITGGSYDPTIGAITSLWRYEGRERAPDGAALERALSTVGIDGVELTYPDKIALKKRGAKLDLGGIAKGHASARALSIAREHGAESALINMGGNVVTLGERPRGGAWRIGVQDPRKEHGTPIAIVKTRGGCVITAGIYERAYEIGGDEFGHIYDPRTGMPVSGDLLSVTVMSEDPTAADALSTASIVMGKERALEMIAGLPSCEAIFIEREEDGSLTLTATRGLRGAIELSGRESRLVFSGEGAR